MTARLVHRPTRITAPLPPVEPEPVAPPPTNPDPQAGSLRMQVLLPVLGALSSVVLIVVLRGSNRLFLVIGAVLLVVALVAGLGLALSMRGGAARQRRVQRENYLDYLERLRTDLRARGRAVRATALALDPAPDALLPLIGDPARLWERRRADRDFARVRVGTGDTVRFGLRVPPAQDPVEPYDPILLAQAEAVAQHLAVVRGVPVSVDLDAAGEVAVVGPRAEVLGLARSLLLQLATWHAPDDVALAVAFPPQAAAEWRGVDWLPHVVADDLFDGPVAARRVAPSLADLGAVLGRDLADRAAYAATVRRSGRRPGGPGPQRLVVVVDAYGEVAAPFPQPDAALGPADLRVTVVQLLADRLHEPPDVTTRVTLSGGLATITDAAAPETPARTAYADLTAQPLFEATARALAGRRLRRTDAEVAESGAPIPVGELLGLDGEPWRPRTPRDFLRVPIGLDDLGAPVLLDLKESAQLGMGPHGLCVGATGSGKSELLRTLVTALAVAHPPEDLSMILVDYKGGAAFAPLAGLPHIAGIIDNLADDPQLTTRARASINGEVVRRQQLLRDAGSSPSITHYRELRSRQRSDGASGAALPPLPHLLLVIDEFGELVTADPEFVDLLITIGRIGRSIGIHLLLSSQRVETGKLRGLDTYLSYRIGLRTFSEAESSLVLDRPDAFSLPPVPGYAYLKVDTTAFLRFRAGFVSGPAGVDPGPTVDPARPLEPLRLPVYNGLATGTAGAAGAVELAPPVVGRTLLAACVDRLSDPDRQVTPVWLPPLPSRLTLASVAARAGRPNLCMQASSPLAVPVGLLDQPAAQRQDPWLLDLGRAGGHVAVIGAPQSGRTTFLQTLAAGIALTATPQQLNLYGLDLTGGSLPKIAGLPHVGGVATRAQPERMRRLLEELLGALAARERVFADRGLDSLDALRTEHAAGRVPEVVAPDVVLLIDGYGTLRGDFEELEAPVAELLQRGGGFGLHVVLGLTRWNELRMAHQSLVGTRVELRLNDALDSVVGRKLAETIRPDQPGRALTDAGLFAQVAVPGDLQALAERVRAAWPGAVAPPIRVLPTDLAPAFLDRFAVAPPALPIGLRQDRMDVALLELGVRDQHLVAFGDAGAGKTTLLRGIARGLVEAFAPDEVAIAALDVRGALAAAVPATHLGGHARTPAEARRLCETVAIELDRRSTGGAMAREGEPRIVLLVDDYDMLAAADPLRPLLPFLPSARELGLHVVLTRPVAGAARAAYDVVLSTVRDSGGTVLVMSGERSEGQVIPSVYASPLPPGRARVLRRGEPPHLVQIAHFAEAAAA